MSVKNGVGAVWKSNLVVQTPRRSGHRSRRSLIVPNRIRFQRVYYLTSVFDLLGTFRGCPSEREKIHLRPPRHETTLQLRSLNLFDCSPITYLDSLTIIQSSNPLIRAVYLTAASYPSMSDSFCLQHGPPTKGMMIASSRQQLVGASFGLIPIYPLDIMILILSYSPIPPHWCKNNRW